MNISILSRIFLAALLFCLCDINGRAQEILISPATIDESGFGYTKVIGQDEDGYFLLMSNLSLNTESDRIGFKNRKYKVAYFNHKLEKKWSKIVEATTDEATIDAVTFFNNRILIITSAYSKPEQKVRYTFTTVDNKGNFTANNTNPVEFLQVTSDYEKSKVILSFNRQLVTLVMREFTSDSSQTVYTAVLDTSFRVLNNKSATVPFPEKKFAFEGYALSVKGDVAILGYHSEKIKALSSKRKIEYYLYASGIDDAYFREYKIPSDKSITELGIAFDNFNKQVVITGFYFERGAVTGAGIFYATLDIIKNDELKINTKVIDGQKNVRLRGESSGMGIIGYPIERIVIRNDGGALLVAEESYTTEYSYYDYFSQSFTQRTEYHFENIVIISVNNDGSVDWSSIVEKDQVSLDDDGVFSSFCSLLNSDQLLLVYNDDISRRNKIIPVAINNKGEQTGNQPGVAKLDGYIILPKSGKQVSENEILIPAFRKRDLHLVRFTF